MGGRDHVVVVSVAVVPVSVVRGVIEVPIETDDASDTRGMEVEVVCRGRNGVTVTVVTEERWMRIVVVGSSLEVLVLVWETEEDSSSQGVVMESNVLDEGMSVPQL